MKSGAMIAAGAAGTIAAIAICYLSNRPAKQERTDIKEQQEIETIKTYHSITEPEENPLNSEDLKQVMRNTVLFRLKCKEEARYSPPPEISSSPEEEFGPGIR